MEENVGFSALEPQPDLPPGVTLFCLVCGTRVRSGQSHTALHPELHQNFAAMFARAMPQECEAYAAEVEQSKAHYLDASWNGWREPRPRSA